MSPVTKRTQSMLVLLTVLLGPMTAVQADIVNGDFETFPDTSWTPISADTFFGVGTLWEDTASYLDYPDDPSYASLSQTFSVTSPDLRLQFDFAIVPVGDEPTETDHFQVVLNGTIYAIASTADTDPFNDGRWHRNYIAPDIPALSLGSHTLMFRLVGDNDGKDTNVVLDNVSLVGGVVPVPGALLLGSLGLSVAGWRLRRRES